MHVYIIDNYDSFTYNLYQLIGEILTKETSQGRFPRFTITVKRNNEVTLDTIRAAKPDRIIISPGPGNPADSNYFGVCASVIKELGPQIPLLGVCLGMQGITHVFGGNIVRASIPMHGKTSVISHDGSGLFTGVPNSLEIMRYHSLVAEIATFPAELRITALTGAGDFNARLKQCSDGQLADLEIMALQHRQFPIYGLQFHPESFATEAGEELLRNFLVRG
jgi:anthranilate synthase component II